MRIRFSAWEILFYFTQNKLYLTTIQRFVYFQIKSCIVDKTQFHYIEKNNRQITCLSWRVSTRFLNRLNKNTITHTPDSILTRLNNPVSVATRYRYVAERHWIELLFIYLSIATNLVAMKLRSILHKFLQTFNYSNFISHLSPSFKSNQAQNLNFSFFFSAQTNGITFTWIPLCQFEHRKGYKNDLT